MRKFLLRWWFTSNWQQDRHEELLRQWHAKRAEPTNDFGVSVRYLHKANYEDVRYDLRGEMLNLTTGEFRRFTQ